ncbi:MAG: hypothetical protein IPL53_09530 [Ignavibacteria bacterium]|nr:hypothetical protein [Ignavibacteria bacterium]
MYLILTGTAESSWMNPEKKNSFAADRSVTTSYEKKDLLPEGLTEDWLNRLTDEKETG